MRSRPLLRLVTGHWVCKCCRCRFGYTSLNDFTDQPPCFIKILRRHALASLLLVDGAGHWEMPPLESTDRHPATSQKLPMSTQSTLPAAPASAPLLPSASIVPIPLSLNLLPKTPLYSTQTGDPNLVANTTVDSSHEEKVPRQQGQDIDRPLSLLPRFVVSIRG